MLVLVLVLVVVVVVVVLLLLLQYCPPARPGLRPHSPF